MPCSSAFGVRAVLNFVGFLFCAGDFLHGHATQRYVTSCPRCAVQKKTWIPTTALVYVSHHKYHSIDSIGNALRKIHHLKYSFQHAFLGSIASLQSSYGSMDAWEGQSNQCLVLFVLGLPIWSWRWRCAQCAYKTNVGAGMLP